MDFPLLSLDVPTPDILDGIDHIVRRATGSRRPIAATDDAQAVAIVE